MDERRPSEDGTSVFFGLYDTTTGFLFIAQEAYLFSHVGSCNTLVFYLQYCWLGSGQTLLDGFLNFKSGFKAMLN